MRIPERGFLPEPEKIIRNLVVQHQPGLVPILLMDYSVPTSFG